MMSDEVGPHQGLVAGAEAGGTKIVDGFDLISSKSVVVDSDIVNLAIEKISTNLI